MSKILIKLPQIKTEANIKRINLLDSSPKSSNSPSKSVSKLKNKTKEILQSLNKLRLISLTPDINCEKSHDYKKILSPKASKKLSILKLREKMKRKKVEDRKLFIKKLEEFEEDITEKEPPVLSVPKNYYSMNIKNIIYNSPNRNYVSRSLETKRRMSKFGKNTHLIETFLF